MTALTPDQKRAAVGKKVVLLFSGSDVLLNSLRDLAESVIDMPGIESFHTPLSWKMALADGNIITGDAENLNNAVKDVFAQINRMIEKSPSASDFMVALSIDETKLTAHPSSIFPKILRIS